MRNTLLLAAVAVMVTACDGENPFMDEADSATDADTSATNIYATEIDADATMNDLDYNDGGTPLDPTDDTLSINNLPFDGSDTERGAYNYTGNTIPGTYDVYESDPALSPGNRKYFAVFRRTDNSQVAAVATGNYIDFGFSGATAQRLIGGIAPIPASGEYTYTGEYAAVRITTVSGGDDDVELISGDVEVFVDIDDFDDRGAVEAIVDNRIVYDNQGTQIGTLDGFISLATGDIDFADGSIGSSTATMLDGDGTQLGTGNWEAIFTGPDGEEIAGFVVITGSTNDSEPDDQAKETGVFITFQN